MKKFILFFVFVFVTIFTTFSKDYNVYVDTSLEFVTYIPMATSSDTNINIYFPKTDSAIIIRDGNLTFKSNSFSTDNYENLEKCLLKLMNSDFMFDNENCIVYQ